jgi:hypothetical protein
MAEFKLPDAVELFSEQSTNITSLWTVYVVATFAAAGYSVAFQDNGFVPERWVVYAVTAGFLAFTIGHMALIKQALVTCQTLAADIRAYLAKDDTNQEVKFKTSLNYLTTTANPLKWSMIAHGIIDLCVIVALLAPLFSPVAKS